MLNFRFGLQEGTSYQRDCFVWFPKKMKMTHELNLVYQLKEQSINNFQLLEIHGFTYKLITCFSSPFLLFFVQRQCAAIRRPFVHRKRISLKRTTRGQQGSEEMLWTRVLTCVDRNNDEMMMKQNHYEYSLLSSPRPSCNWSRMLLS